MRFKPGDRVRIKDMKWYNDNKNEYGEVDCGTQSFTESMALCCGEVLTIERIVSNNSYFMKGEAYWWNDDMIEGLADEETFCLTEKDWDKNQEIIIRDGYEFQDENGNVINTKKITLVKKKPKYPTTYEKCCKIVQTNPHWNLCYHTWSNTWDFATNNPYANNLLNKLECLYKLIICRDAYWKIAGDWKPEFRFGNKKYCIMTKDNKVITATVEETNRILAFPTVEMRDTFYENFKDLINDCKELL